MYKTIIFCGVVAFTMAQTANGQTQNNRYLVGSSASHTNKILQDAPTPAADANSNNQAAASVATGCDTGPAYGSIGCDGGGAIGGNCGVAGGGCDGAGAGGCCGAAGGACGGAGAGGCCGVGRSFFNRGGGGDCGCCNSYNYLRTFVGWNKLHGLRQSGVSTRSGWMTGLAIGNRENNLRKELEISFRDNSYDAGVVTGSVRNTAVMANLLYDIKLLRINDARSYIGGGLGTGYTELQTDGVGTSNSTTFAYQFITGMEKPLRNGAHGFIEYRYFGTPDANFGAGRVSLHNQNILLGIQFRR